jgi:hypothetical protein
MDARYEVARIAHRQAYSLNGVYSNGAESFFSRLRRAEMGHHHHVAGPYLVRYAQQSAWASISAGCPTGTRCRWRPVGTGFAAIARFLRVLAKA